MKSLASAGYQLVRELGRGAQSVVSLAQYKGSQLRCVKCIKKTAKDFSIDDFKNEFRIMSDLGKHPRIAYSHEIFQDQASYYLISDSYSGGDFASLRKNASKSGVQMTENWWRNLFSQAFEGLVHLHEHAIIHCDIKEANLMVKTSNYHLPEVVIIDFGVSQSFESERSIMIGTPNYMPPEVWKSRKWLPVGDVFSMGVVILQMLTDNIPNHGKMKINEKQRGIFAENCNSVADVAKATTSREAPINDIPHHLSSIGGLCERLLYKDWLKRPTATQVLEDPWFQCGSARVAKIAPPILSYPVHRKEEGIAGDFYPRLLKCSKEADAADVRQLFSCATESDSTDKVRIPRKSAETFSPRNIVYVR
jgi:serine/threonine protein kinase